MDMGCGAASTNPTACKPAPAQPSSASIPTVSGPRAAPEILGNEPQGTLKFYDPHNHMTGMCHWIGLALSLDEGIRLRAKQQSSPAFLSYIERMERRNFIDGEGHCVHQRLKPSDYDLYIYEYMSRGHLMGENVSDPTLTRQLEFLRSQLVRLAAGVLASPVQRLAAQQRDRERMEFGSTTLMPLMLCLQRAEAQMEPLEGLIRLLSMSSTASPLMDFDTAYVAREVLEVQLQSKRDVFRCVLLLFDVTEDTGAGTEFSSLF